MMKKLIALSLVAIALGGCNSAKKEKSGIQINPKLTTYGKEDMLQKEIEIPANASTDNFRKLLMAVDFKDVAVKAGKIPSASVQTLSSRLQTEMAKLKRFSIFSIHNRGGVRTVTQLGDVGEANIENIENRELQALDYVLTGSFTLTKERQQRFDHDQLIYEVECDFNCEELKTKTVKFAEKAKGRSIRTQAMSLSGKKIGGFSEEDEKQAIYEAAMKAIAVLANKLGNTFPVGGKVMGVSRGGRFAVDKGFEHGIAKDAQVVLYVVDCGIDIPLAIGQASPSKAKTTVKIYKWNEGDADADPIVNDLKNGNWKNYKLYGVQYGMPIPPEWENAYK